MPRPCRSLVPAAPPSVAPCPAPPPLPCASINGLHRAPTHTRPSTTTIAPLAPPLDLTVGPHFPLLLRPNQSSKRVTLDLLVLLDFHTPPSLAGPPPPTARASPELLLTAGAQLQPPQPQLSTPTGFPQPPRAPPPLSRRYRLVSLPDFGQETPSLA
jgi:hypothetical protein